MTRFRRLVESLLLLGLLAGPLRGETPLTVERLAEGLDRPVGAVAAPGDATRLFVLEQHVGRIRIIDLAANPPVLRPDPFLVIPGLPTLPEQGLLGLAFAPDYATSGTFYVNLTGTDGAIEIRRYQVSADPDVADAASMTPVLRIPQPYANHNGGWMDFGADGKLWIGTGDGGNANDPGSRAQNPNELLGKLLRIDPTGDDFPTDPERNYAIPADNPFGAGGGAPEVWSIGLRNPWRCDLDGDRIWIADVGQESWEEVNVLTVAAAREANFGWRCVEGPECTGLAGCDCPLPTFVEPVHWYAHPAGCSITGGVVYRGAAIPDLCGAYFYADYCSGAIASFRVAGGHVTDFRDRAAELDPPGPDLLAFVSSFGRDPAGEIVICTMFPVGAVWRIVPGGPIEPWPCPTDLDGDAMTGFGDLVALLAQWGPCPPPCAEDLDGDGAVGFGDLLDLLAAWGPCGCPE